MAVSFAAMAAVVVMVAMVAVTGKAARAAENGENNGVVFDIDAPPPTRHQITESFTYGASVTLLYRREREFDLDRARKNNLSVLEPSGHLALSFDPSHKFGAFAAFELSNEIPIVEQGVQRRRDRTLELKVSQAYITVRDIADGLGVRIGRQRMNDEREWLYDQKFDAVRLFYGVRNIGVEASVSQVRLVDDDLLNAQFNDRTNNYMITVKYRPTADMNIHGYAILRDELVRRKEMPLFLGLRAFGEPFENTRFWVDVAHVRGDDGVHVNKPEPDKIRGVGFDIGATYVLDRQFSPSITVDYAFGTGDSNSTDGVNRNFRQTGLHNNTHRFNGVANFQYYGEAFNPELSNMHIFTAGVGVKPTKSSSLDVVYHYYRQHRATDRIRRSAIRFAPTGRNRNLGQEVDLIFGARLLRNIYFEFNYGAFFPGAAFDDDADIAHFAGFELRYTF